jgi:hypothetical protein
MEKHFSVEHNHSRYCLKFTIAKQYSLIHFYCIGKITVNDSVMIKICIQKDKRE